MGDGPFRPGARRATLHGCSPPPANLVISGSASSIPTTGSGSATKPDIVVIDPRLPELDGGMSLIKKVRAAAPRVRILVIGAANLEGTDLQRAADGFVRKTFRPSDLVAAVVAAALPLAS